MSAKYNSFQGPDIEVDLRRPGFSLSLNDEFDGMIIPAESESLSIGISMYEFDKKAKQFSKLFGNLGRYRRVNVELMYMLNQEAILKPSNIKNISWPSGKQDYPDKKIFIPIPDGSRKYLLITSTEALGSVQDTN